MKSLLIDSSATSTSTPRVLPSAHSIPEMNHNELEVFGSTNAASMEGFVVVLAARCRRSRTRRTSIRHREASSSRGTGSDVIEVHSQGISPLARMLTLVMLTQLPAIYAGLINDVDPGPVPVIENFKQQLADE